MDVYVYEPEMLLIVGALLWALNGDGEDGMAAGAVGVHVGGPYAPILVAWKALKAESWWSPKGSNKLEYCFWIMVSSKKAYVKVKGCMVKYLNLKKCTLYKKYENSKFASYIKNK